MLCGKKKSKEQIKRELVIKTLWAYQHNGTIKRALILPLSALAMRQAEVLWATFYTSAHPIPPIDVVRLSNDIATIGRGEEHRHARQVLGGAHAAKGHFLPD